MIVRVKVCSGISSQARGYMFRSTYYDALLFDLSKPRKVNLHMFFVFFPIDIYYIDEKGRVLRTYYRVKPFIPLVKGTTAFYILETAIKTRYKINDVINVSDLKRRAKSSV